MMSNEKSAVRRVLLAPEEANNIASFVDKLRGDSCKTDTSKVVNTIVSIFFKKHCSSEYEAIKKQFFDKKSHLRQLISSSSNDELDKSIELYLSQTKNKKRRGRKTKDLLSVIEEDENASS